MPPRLNASSFFRPATMARSASSSLGERHLGALADVQVGPLAPGLGQPGVQVAEVGVVAPSGTKLVPSQPSAISPVSSSILGEIVAR